MAKSLGKSLGASLIRGLFFAPREPIFKVKSWLIMVKNSKAWKLAQINRGGGVANLQ